MSTAETRREPLDRQENVQVSDSTYAEVTALCVAYGGVSRAAVWRMAYARARASMLDETGIQVKTT
jgi:hypothetical protein